MPILTDTQKRVINNAAMSIAGTAGAIVRQDQVRDIVNSLTANPVLANIGYLAGTMITFAVLGVSATVFSDTLINLIERY